MLFYYDNNGKLVTISPHGEIPRQGGALVLYVLMNKNFNDNANDPGEDGTGMQNRMMTARFKCPSEITFSEDYPMTLNSELWEFKKLPGESIGSLVDGEEYYLFTVDLSNTYANKEAGNLEIVFTLYKYEMENDEPVIDTSMTINLGKATVFVEETLGLAPYSGVGMTYTEYQSLMASLTQYNSYVTTELPKKADRTNLEQKIEADIIRVNTIKGTVDDSELVNMVGDFNFNNDVWLNKIYFGNYAEPKWEIYTGVNNDLYIRPYITNAMLNLSQVKVREIYDDQGKSKIQPSVGLINFYAYKWDDTSQYKRLTFSYAFGLHGLETPTRDDGATPKSYVDGAIASAISTKADLNNPNQNITARNITARNITANDKLTVYDIRDLSDTSEIEMLLSAINFYAKKWDNPSQYKEIIFSYDNGLEIDEPTKSYNPTTKNYVDNNLAGKGNKIDLEIDSDFKLKAKLYNGTTLLSTSTVIDLPLESVVVSGSYDSVNKKVILTLEDGSTIEFSVADLISGLQSEITENNKLNSDLVDDTNSTHKFVSAQEKAQITTNQNAISNIKDGTSIDSFGDVESALALKENLSNKVVSVSSSSTDAQYPSAKCVYDNLDDYSSLNMTNAKIEEYMATYNNVSASLVGDKISLTNVTFENGYIKFNAKNVSFANGKIIINN